jgi:hypothetical protein
LSQTWSDAAISARPPYGDGARDEEARQLYVIGVVDTWRNVMILATHSETKQVEGHRRYRRHAVRRGDGDRREVHERPPGTMAARHGVGGMDGRDGGVPGGTPTPPAGA